MYEDVIEIFKYLPIRREQLENEYISYLSITCSALDLSNEISQPFMIMPFHLLFMLSLQYKLLRISKELKSKYLNAFIIKNISRDINILCSPSSVFDLSLLQERSLPDLFRLVELDETTIKRIKKLIDYRNGNLAHANGGMAKEFDVKLHEYLDCLDILQNKFLKLNDKLAKKFKSEIKRGDDRNYFIETRLLKFYLCPTDFLKGDLNKKFGKVGSYI